MRQIRAIDKIAANTRLDTAAGAIRDAVHKVLKPGTAKDLLHGVWLGHPLHPALAQFPVGCFVGAALLDLTGNPGKAADRLIGWGVLGSVPAALAGAADYADSHEDQQRVGVVHAAANSTALLCYLVSLGLRAKDKRLGGLVFGLAGIALVGAGAMLGGDLAFRRALGSNHAEEVPHTGPADWCDLGLADEFGDGELVRRSAGDIPVFVLRHGARWTVLHDRCSHLAAPLSTGELTTVDGDECVVCPWHGSVFRIDDGQVVHGPATAPQPVLDSRVQDGRLQTKVREIPGVPAS
ncbi:MAG: Rieske (2Fe-2S) protein [Kibdelosporangium sp.]